MTRHFLLILFGILLVLLIAYQGGDAAKSGGKTGRKKTRGQTSSKSKGKKGQTTGSKTGSKVSGTSKSKKTGQRGSSTSSSTPDYSGSMSDLVVSCSPFLLPTRASPPNRVRPLLVTMQFVVMKVVAVDNVKQTVSVRGKLNIQWEIIGLCKETKVSLVRKAVGGNKIETANAIDSFWNPRMQFLSSVNDVGMLGDYFKLAKATMSRKPSTNGTVDIKFEIRRVGIFETECPLDLRVFPFDQQDCGFTFVPLKAATNVAYSPQGHSMELLLDNNNSTQWTVQNINNVSWEVGEYYETNALNKERIQPTSKITFHLVMHRRPEFFITNIMMPSLLLALLNTCAIMITPKCVDRIALNVGLVMALSVFVTVVIQYIPETPQRVFLAEYTQILCLFCALCTIQSMLLFCLVSAYPVPAKRKIYGCMTVMRLGDCIGFTITIAVLVWPCYTLLNLILSSKKTLFQY